MSYNGVTQCQPAQGGQAVVPGSLPCMVRESGFRPAHFNIFPQSMKIYVSLRLRMQNAVPAQPCVGKIRISLVLLNFLHCNFRLWFETP